jgi:fructose-1,6-bisphosphatase/inositol monophosphatase family enzyme
VTGEELGIDTRAERQWYVDPIDGTANFCEGLPRWGTLIGLAVESEMVVGVVDLPLFGRRSRTDTRLPFPKHRLYVELPSRMTIDRASSTASRVNRCTS